MEEDRWLNPACWKGRRILHLPTGTGGTHHAAMNEETIFWKGSSSQWLNLAPFSVCLAIAAVITVAAIGLFQPLLFIALVFPFGYMFWRFLVIRTRTYELTSERVRVTSGVINQTIDEIELYRVKDTQMLRTWWMRLTGLATIQMETSDRTMPNLVIPAVAGGADLRELLRKHVEAVRDRKRVRELDYDQVGEGPDDHPAET